MIHLLWEWYGQVWPNAIVMVPGFVWAHLKIKKHINKKLDDK